ncbi:hypothetical protein L218DRAFT_921227 [Marasmius fiardii PR-910]|nr:hypothetical protein L218DRAFT_921227 [Marasmius fiardii PR-910]
MITLYDVGPTTSKEHPSFSPFVRRTRYSLDYKKIPYKVVWVNFFTMEEVAKRIGAPPTGVRADGSPRYTVPFIHDDTTGATVSESLLIAEYLDKTYPETPRLVPEGTRALQAIYADTVPRKIVPWMGVIRSKIDALNTPEFQKGIAKAYGPPPNLSPEQSQAGWEAGKAGFDEVERWYADHGGLFLAGDKPLYADFTLIGWFHSLRILLASEERWKEVETMNNGRWIKMLEAADKYESAEVL